MANFNLPDITFAEKDSSTIETEIIDQYEETSGITLADADPRKKLLQSEVPIITGQRAVIDYSAKQNLLAYAAADFLDHIGVLVGCNRIAATAATATMRFSLLAVRTLSVTIPAGRLVTSGDGVFFATAAESTITAGSLYADVKVQCTKAGAKGNGYAVGTITTLVKPISYIVSATNITESEGGTDEETDDAYRERIQQAPESFSTAGPTGAYEYWAKTASSTIIDVSVTSPSAGVVAIYPLVTGGEIPGQEILDAVLEICNDEKIRPLTDNVQVLVPEQVSYSIDVSYWIDKTNESVASALQTAIEAVVTTYITWQKAELGRDIDPSELIYKMKAAGAKRVTVTSPTYLALTDSQVAKESTTTINYGGIES
ncbi:hypothetical protein SPSIL_009140 [Sporomusa silvacetica DSM 10669]|uniref:Baseplate J-like protein n=1 Tax=Sporomusa silvacetica DSM 10669 TaxID=1123289 RepID=A0ABZ3IGK8_9FIRM|nr:baseplate J/gp47 family protein [Sporomusa silvacetica]OZC13126.1 baseplate J-like protein [Sporomusa silvacetica DSM 10669]